MVPCPYCNHPAMSIWRKCILAPEMAVRCSSCKRKVGVPWLAVAAAVPIALGVVGAVRLSAPWSIVSLAVGILAYVVLQQFVVPLVGRDA